MRAAIRTRITFKRFCNRCEVYFKPKSKFNRICDKCKIKSSAWREKK